MVIDGTFSVCLRVEGTIRALLSVPMCGLSSHPGAHLMNPSPPKVLPPNITSELRITAQEFSGYSSD